MIHAKQKIAFLGLGVMGFPMAGILANAGHEVTVYNRSAEKSEKWLHKYKGRLANTAKQAAQEADFVIACVGNDDDVRDMCIGQEGTFQSMKNNSVFIDHTTTSAQVAKQMYEQALQFGLHFMDAPVSGGQVGAEQGKLTIMCGADENVFQSAKPILEHYGAMVTLMGEVGSGQLTKMVNQICIAGLVQALAEGVAFAQNAGLDANQVFDVISKGAAQSWQMDNRHSTMLANKFDFGFAVKWMRKDLGHCLAQAKRNGSALPITEIVDGYYAKVEQLGGENLDTSSLLTLLPRPVNTSE